MMRLFFAMTFDDASKSKLKLIQDKLKQKGMEGRYTRKDNFHITLAFIGESTNEEAQQLTKILHTVTPSCDQIVVDHLGTFHQSGRQLAWLGIKNNPTIAERQNALIETLEHHGFVTESRTYVPHITLARHVEKQAPLDEVLISPLTIPIYSIALMESKTIEGQLSYQVIEEVACSSS